MFNFKQWRTERNLNKTQAAALLDQDGSYWTTLEGSPKPHKAAAVAEVLKHHDSREQWQELKRKASLLTPAEIEGFLMAGKAQGLTQDALGKMCGFSGSSTLKKFVNEKGKLSKARFVSLLCIAAQIEKMKSAPEPEQAKKATLPVIERTEHLVVRGCQGQKVLTYTDIAEAFNVTESTVRSAYERNKAEWVSHFETQNTPETFTHVLNNRQVRLFTFRGAMRFVRYLTTPVANTIYNHLLDLIEAEAQGRIDVKPQHEDQVLDATILNLQELKAAKQQIQQIEQRVQELEQRPTGSADPEKVAKSFAFMQQEVKARYRHLKKIKDLIVAQAKKNNDSFSKKWTIHGFVWNHIYDNTVPTVNSKDDYQTVAQVNTSIEAALLALTRLGGALPEQLRFEFEGVHSA